MGVVPQCRNTFGTLRIMVWMDDESCHPFHYEYLFSVMYVMLYMCLPAKETDMQSGMCIPSSKCSGQSWFVRKKTRATAHSLSLCAHSLPVGFYRRRMTDDANVCSPHSHLFVEKGFIIDVSMCVTCDGRWEMGEIRWMLDGVQVRLDWISQYRYDQKLSHGEMIAQSCVQHTIYMSVLLY